MVDFVQHIQIVIVLFGFVSACKLIHHNITLFKLKTVEKRTMFEVLTVLYPGPSS